MTDTIHITNDYTVAAGKTLNFVDQDGFEFDNDVEHDVTLTIAGAVRVTSSNTALDLDGVEAGNGDVVTAKSGVFSIDVAGDAYGVNAYSAQFHNAGTWNVTADGRAVAYEAFQDGVFDNRGAITVHGGTLAAGVSGHVTTFSNEGSLTVVSAGGGALGVSLGMMDYSFTNSGHITVTGSEHDFTHAVIMDHYEGFTAVYDNSGIIRTNGYAFYEEQSVSPEQNSPDQVMNSGKIYGDFFMGLGPDLVDNTGFIQGQIDMGDGDDVVHNHEGAIVGEVLLGAGDDLFDTDRGVVKGGVYGGADADILTGGRAADLLYGDGATESADDGADQLSGGAGADTLFGGGGADTLDGGAGRDVMTGGTGLNTFTFDNAKDSALKRPDLITDLKAGDVIDLSHIDADATQAGQQHFVLVTAFDGHAGELMLSYDAHHDRTQILGDLNGDGTADFQILASGDQSAFTSFVL